MLGFSYSLRENIFSVGGKFSSVLATYQYVSATFCTKRQTSPSACFRISVNQMLESPYLLREIYSQLDVIDYHFWSKYKHARMLLHLTLPNIKEFQNTCNFHVYCYKDFVYNNEIKNFPCIWPTSASIVSLPGIRFFLVQSSKGFVMTLKGQTGHGTVD